MDLKLTFDVLPVAGVLLVLAAYYVPYFKDWYEKLEPQWKQGFMAIVLAVAALGAVLGSMAGVLTIYPVNWGQALWLACVDWVVALIANAGIYKATNYVK